MRQFSIAIFTLAFTSITGCAVSSQDPAPEQTGTSSQALKSLPYSCADNGACDCHGTTDCNTMFGICAAGSLFCAQNSDLSLVCWCDKATKQAP